MNFIDSWTDSAKKFSNLTVTDAILQTSALSSKIGNHLRNVCDKIDRFSILNFSSAHVEIIYILD